MNRYFFFFAVSALTLAPVGALSWTPTQLSNSPATQQDSHSPSNPGIAMKIINESDQMSREINPFFTQWTGPFGLPPFDLIKAEHYMPAIEAGIKTAQAEIAAIANNPAPADFENTFLALDQTGALLENVQRVFYNLYSSDNSEALQQIARQMEPLTTAFDDDIHMNSQLFARIESIWQKRQTLGLTPVQVRLVDEVHKDFVRAGAMLNGDFKTLLRAINQELSRLGLEFAEKVLASTNDFQLLLENPDDLAGLSPALIASSAESAEKAGHKGKYLFTLQYPSIWPFVQQSTRRDLRQKMISAYANQAGAGTTFDNSAIVSNIAKKRIEKARMLGYKTWAEYVLSDRMAQDSQKVVALLDKVWAPALARAQQEVAIFATAALADKVEGPIQPWDWHFYAEKVRAEKYGLDESKVREYFPLDNVLKGAFTLAERLYGVTFTPVDGLKLYHPEVKAFEVKDADGSHLGLFLADYHPRASKRGGAWSSTFRSQEFRDGKNIRPIVVNVGNFTKPCADRPALLSIDEVETLFHELGHGLHSLFSQVQFKTLARVPWDFVELPSQIMENWVLEPELLRLYARHFKTGKVIPKDMVEKLDQGRKFNQGFATVEYLAAAYLDMAWHDFDNSTKVPSADEIEKTVFSKIGLIPEILPRYKSTYFRHIFSGGGSYSAGYYSYIWSGVLDADAFEAFVESKDIFNKKAATLFRKEVLEKGGMADAMEMYKAFRGHEPSIEPLLRQRGLD